MFPFSNLTTKLFLSPISDIIYVIPYFLICSNSSLLLLSRDFTMPKRKSPEDFLMRARKNGSENSRHIITREEVKKKLETGTLKRYTCMIALWNSKIPIIQK